MRPAPRFIALATILVVAWTALWPLVSEIHARLVGEEVLLCHQAGGMVAPGEAPVKPDRPASGSGKTHCPLCIMAFYGTAATKLVVPPFQFSTLSERLRQPHCAKPPHQFRLALPQSRAPPTTFPA